MLTSVRAREHHIQRGGSNRQERGLISMVPVNFFYGPGGMDNRLPEKNPASLQDRQAAKKYYRYQDPGSS